MHIAEIKHVVVFVSALFARMAINRRAIIAQFPITLILA